MPLVTDGKWHIQIREDIRVLLNGVTYAPYCVFQLYVLSKIM